MSPLIIALICAASFGAVVALSAFIRQLILSRDKALNDEAQRRALTHEANELEKLRNQMQNNRRFDSHYNVLGANKNAIVYLDAKINEILHAKLTLIERYGKRTIEESNSIIDGKTLLDRKSAHDKLKAKIDEEIKFYDTELEGLQQRRVSLWDAHLGLQEQLVTQEKVRNASLDALYKQHSSVLEKVFIRHTDDSEHVAKQSIDASTSTFKTIIMAPIQFLLQYFNLSSGISFTQTSIEQAARNDVEQAESDINQSGNETSPDPEPAPEEAEVDIEPEDDTRLMIA
jgi:hypothetical protein